MTKTELIDKFNQINQKGWIENTRNKSNGNVGNLLEDLLGIEENNLALPDAGEWEIKAQKIKFEPASLLTLFHFEPEPRHLKVVPHLIRHFGWFHSNGNELSFRQTIRPKSPTDRGFYIWFTPEKVEVQFDLKYVNLRHHEWLSAINVNNFIIPYWNYDELEVKLQQKLKNCFYVLGANKQIDDIDHYKYCDVVALEDFDFGKFLTEFKSGNVFIDFNAKTTHNHGTAFRTRQNILPKFYKKVTQII